MAVIYVPNDYASIQAAIDAAVAGDTVLVRPGTYTEPTTPASTPMIVINKPLTLQSTDGPAVTILDGNSATERYYMVSIEADNVVFKGFTVTNPRYSGTADASGILTSLSGRQDNIKILDNIIHDIGSLTRPVVSFGTFGINVGPVDGLEIGNNVIYHIGNAETNPDNGWAIGIFVYGNDAVDTATSVNIHDNTVYDIESPVAVNDGINSGGDSKNITIADNTIHAVVKRGIVTSPGMLGPVTITGNQVTGATSYGMLLRSPYAQTVTDNTITLNDIGVHVNDTVSTTPEIHDNNIYNNTSYDLVNDALVRVNAQYNWWGSVTGPDGKVLGLTPTEYTPFLEAPISEVTGVTSRVKGVTCTQLARTPIPDKPGFEDIILQVTIVLTITLLGPTGMPIVTFEAPDVVLEAVTLYVPTGTTIYCAALPGTTVESMLAGVQVRNIITLCLLVAAVGPADLLLPDLGPCQPPASNQVNPSRAMTDLGQCAAVCVEVTKVFDERARTDVIVFNVPVP
ncbi:right-handed parallel beta-helix repeat-containing protein [Sulfobacillus harzensis]|uniref:Periplasmic copper-binding protein NosD beta helix domain-containing protein n=1 Tax=Sulfobacillus harzensis TaxID=2729629 RepID=A0A7Y0L312_9FIRM|nr:right-handed parallel beta-helix repeat-containing protein [Sulfobacillus harzensis]NMP22057.1 hypothetical protein [Sulfobacillus harzensis]